VGKDDIQHTILQFIAAMVGFGQLCCVFPWGGLTCGDLEMNEQCQNQQKTGFNFQQGDHHTQNDFPGLHPLLDADHTGV